MGLTDDCCSHKLRNLRKGHGNPLSNYTIRESMKLTNSHSSSTSHKEQLLLSQVPYCVSSYGPEKDRTRVPKTTTRFPAGVLPMGPGTSLLPTQVISHKARSLGRVNAIKWKIPFNIAVDPLLVDTEKCHSHHKCVRKAANF